MKPERMIENRCFYIGRGERTLTVNICDKNNRRGDYDWIIRIYHRREEVTEEKVRSFPTIDSLRAWLEGEMGGDLEKKPRNPDEDDSGIAAAEPPAEDFPWIAQAVKIVELCLDELVDEFLAKPYLHRVEHSLHARLFAMLAAHPHLSTELPLKGGMLTQPIHKEWPETVASAPAPRGNFDLAILSPALLAGSSVKTFGDGDIPAPLVIEMGLNYRAWHLAQDAEKLLQSKVKHGYLVHFSRREITPTERELILKPGGKTKVAFACTHGAGSFKKVGDSEIQTCG